MSAIPDDRSAKSLNDWYEHNVGYRPQVDEPTMTHAELLALCLSVATEQESHQ